MRKLAGYMGMMLAVLAAMQGCGDREYEEMRKKGNGLDTFEFSKPPTPAEVEARRKVREEEESRRSGT